MRVAVFGSTTYLGRSLVTHLLLHGHEVHEVLQATRGDSAEDNGGALTQSLLLSTSDQAAVVGRVQTCDAAVLIAYHNILDRRNTDPEPDGPGQLSPGLDVVCEAGIRKLVYVTDFSVFEPQTVPSYRRRWRPEALSVVSLIERRSEQCHFATACMVLGQVFDPGSADECQILRRPLEAVNGPLWAIRTMALLTPSGGFCPMLTADAVVAVTQALCTESPRLVIASGPALSYAEYYTLAWECLCRRPAALVVPRRLEPVASKLDNLARPDSLDFTRFAQFHWAAGWRSPGPGLAQRSAAEVVQCLITGL